MHRRPFSAFFTCLAIGLSCAPVSAEEHYPTRPITLVVQYGAGSSTDITARVIADLATKKLGQSVVVENRPGASSMLAGEYVLSQPADGYTVLFAAAGMFETISNFKNSPYAPEKWTPVTMILKTPYVIGVRSDLAINSLEELKEYSGAQSKPLNAGILGNLTGITGVYTQAVEKEAGITLNKVIYKSGSDVSNDILAGRIDVAVGSTTMYKDVYKNGAMRFIGSMTADPIAGLDGVPTLASQGLPLEVEAWLGVYVKAGTADVIVKTLADAVHEAAQSDRMKELAEQYTSVISVGSPDDLQAFAYDKTYLGWLNTAKSLGIEIEAK